MNTEPEPLAAILAEMRREARSGEHADGPLIEDYADRIEAAAEREYEEAKAYFEKLHDGPSMICTAKNCAMRNVGLAIANAAPGNAAALREALKDVLDHAPFATDHATMLTGGNDLLARLRHAYYAPPRNCDRFATGEEAFSKFFVEERVAERLAAKEMECTPQKLRFALACFFADWLFAEAEGGSGEEKK